MSEDELKKRFDDFATMFEGKMFELISGFATIQDSFSRVQEGLDFLGKIRIQTAENKQVMTKVEQSFKNLERKLREMSLGGFMIPEHKESESSGLEADDDFGALLSTTISSKSVTSDDLKEFGDAAELPSLDDIIGKTEAPKKVQEPEPIKEPEPVPEPEPIREPEPIPEPEPIRVPEPIPEPEPIRVPEPIPEPIRELELLTTPVPKPVYTPPKDEITPLPTPLPKLVPEPTEDLTPTPIAPKPIVESDIGLSPLPTIKKQPEFSALPNKPGLHAPIPTPVLTSNPVVSEQGITAAPKPTPEPVAREAPPATSEDLASQKVINLIGPQDVWHNLGIDIQLSEMNEQIALSLALANDNLKRFVKFHKVLFEILKIASIFRKKGNSVAHDNDKNEILKKIDSWKFELK